MNRSITVQADFVQHPDVRNIRISDDNGEPEIFLCERDEGNGASTITLTLAQFDAIAGEVAVYRRLLESAKGF